MGTHMINNQNIMELKHALLNNNNTHLLHLGLFNNTIDEYGVLELAKILTKSKLQVLYLGNNRIGNVGAAALGEALKHNTTLKRLYLNQGSIGNDGLQMLAEGLIHNKTLEYLDLQHNPGITRIGLQALERALEHSNMTLQTVKLDSNNHGDSVAIIQTYLRLNRLGRVHALRNSTLPDQAWNHVLQKASHQSDLLFLLIQSKPSLFRRR